MANLNLKIDTDAAVIEFDQQDSKINVLNHETMKELDTMFDELEAKVKRGAIKALIIASKKDVFIAGADIKEIENINKADEAFLKAEAGKAVLKKLDGLDIVTIAAINGACLGGGLELALACKYRVATFSDSVKIGLPEVKLGIIPGFGGTYRLPRLVGLIASLNMILTGEPVSGKEALKRGIVDRLFPANRLLEGAIEFAKEILKNKTEARSKRNRSFLTLFLEETPFGRAVLLSGAKKDVLMKTKGFYPAPLEAIELIKRTYGRKMAQALSLESRVFSELAVTDVSKNLIKVFYLQEEFRKVAWVDSNIRPAQVKRCGVVGAGVMGGGIAQLLGFYDIPTRIKDINCAALSTALRVARKLFDYAVMRGKLKQHNADFKMSMISPTLTYKGFENTDLVIEAVVEDMKVKEKVFGELSRITPSGTILASNTSSLPILNMARSLASPERVIGLHFFNPVHRMPLVEVIRSAKTSDQTLATTIAFGRRIGKVVIVVKDVVGFLINRILLAYLNEAGYLFEDGVAMDRIDTIARGFGMPVGPVELMDEIGIDVGYKVAKILEEAYGERMAVAAVLVKVKEKGLLGKKAGKGFYIYKGKKKLPNPEVCAAGSRISYKSISDDSVRKRLIYVMVNEAARCLEETVADRPQTVDIGMIMGTGFPPFRAGLLAYADLVGIDEIVRSLRGFEKESGAVRFMPCGKLIKMLEERKTFYGNV